MIIHAEHRNLALALRHMASLERQYIVAGYERRSASGHFSVRGHHFYIEVFKKKKRKKKIELVLHFDYGSTKKRNLIRFQVHVFGPSGVSDREAIQAVRDIEEGETPKGWTWKAIYWGRPGGDVDRTDELDMLPQKSAILGGEAKVSRRITIARHRRIGKRRRGKR